MRPRVRGLAGLLLALAAGCAQWNEGPQEKTGVKFPAPKMSPDSVVMEVLSVRITPANAADANQAWQEADEQIVATEDRRRLLENGLRCGKVGLQLPVALQRLVDSRPKTVDITSPDPERLKEEALSKPFRVQSRAGVRTAFPAGTVQDLINVLVNEQGAVRGETFEQAQCMLAMRTFPQTNNQVRVELTPEIEYGEPKNRHIPADGMWRLDFSRDRKEFDNLRIDVALAPGETLLVSCGADGVGLGGTFFSRPRGESVLLLVRLAQTQQDHLFDDDDLAPIATTGEL